MQSLKVSRTSATSWLTSRGICTKCGRNAYTLRHDPRYIQARSEYEEHWNHVQHTIQEWILCIELIRTNHLRNAAMTL